jgi:hypothetical protein
MSHESAKIELENDHVRVTRVKHGRRGAGGHGSRHDRLIVYLRDGHVVRTEGGKQDEIHRKAGDVVWRGRSDHHVEQIEEGEHEVLIIELKR